MKSSAMRRWLREERAREWRQMLASIELPPPPSRTSWFVMQEYKPKLWLNHAARLAISAARHASRRS